MDRPLRLFAAGSLRGALTEIARIWSSRSDVGIEIELGPSGVLRERIEAGERADLFISADRAHPAELVRRGMASALVAVAGNEVCLFGYFSGGETLDEVVAVLLDPNLRLGTSTPGDDPGGDYAFAVFRRVDALRPGSFKILSSQSHQLVGGRNSPPTPAGMHPVASLFSRHHIDLFLGYYTSALAVRSALPAVRIARLPVPIVVRTEYVLAELGPAHRATRELVELILSPVGRTVFKAYGFQTPNGE